MKSILCPYFTPVSFIFMMCIIDAVMYIATLIYSVTKYGGLEPDVGVFLGPTMQTLHDFGAKVSKG